MSKVQFHPQGYTYPPVISPNLVFEEIDGNTGECLLYLDHICVGYFCNDTGALCLLPMETGMLGNDDTTDVEYLKDHGIALTEVKQENGTTLHFLRVKK